ncbi:MAG: hypothetical protein MJE12_15750, partial [Alphaproteobacteria bacterium]|nr:hypothetical protein [Alphaproteobacteria bacterium]
QFARSLAKRRTGFSAAGVSLDGSPLDLLEDIAVENEIDLLGIRQRGLAQAREFTLAASESRFRARNARQQGALGAGVRLASGSAGLIRRGRELFPDEKGADDRGKSTT